MPDFRAISGARAKLFIDNKEAGWATDVTAQESIQQIPVEVLGDIDPQEFEAVGRSVTMSAGFVRIKKKSLRELGIWPRGTTADIIEFPPMTAELYDTVSDEPIAKVVHLKAQNLSWRLDRRGLKTVQASFVGMRILDEQDLG